MTNQRLLAKLRNEADRFTEAEGLIANFLLTNQQGVPFETAASMAEKLAISPVTVGRFCRRLGYRNFRELKTEFKLDIAAAPWPLGEELGSMLEAGGEEPALRRDLDLNMAGLVEVYRLVQTPEWRAMAEMLARAGTVHVAGFQTERGIAQHFANLLQYVRSGVHVADIAGGNFSEVLLNGAADGCVVIVETRRYSRQAQLLARRCHQRGLKIIIVTDKYCSWARTYTRHVLALPTESGIFWATMVPIVSALTLLANSVVVALGPAVEQRLADVSDLYQDFVGHVGKSGRKT